MNKMNVSKGQSGFSLIELLIVTVVLTSIIGIMSAILTGVQSNFSFQRGRTEAINDSVAALDMITRLVRTAGNNPNSIVGLQGIDPEPPVGGMHQTIRIRSDWRGSTMSSYPDGDINDPFEDVRFLVVNNKLMKKEPSDPQPVEFLENVIALQFIYYDTNNVMIVDPIANNASISRVEITAIVSRPNSPAMTFVSSAYMRKN